MTTSSAYGKAAFDYALAHHQLDAWHQLCTIASPLSLKTFKQSITNPDDILSIFSDHLDLNAAQKHWLSLMITHRHLFLLPKIASNFIDRYMQHKNIMPVSITTAKNLAPHEKEALVMKLEKKINQKICANFDTNPSILGGIKLMLRDRLIDYSLTNILKQIYTET